MTDLPYISDRPWRFYEVTHLNETGYVVENKDGIKILRTSFKDDAEYICNAINALAGVPLRHLKGMPFGYLSKRVKSSTSKRRQR